MLVIFHVWVSMSTHVHMYVCAVADPGGHRGQKTPLLGEYYISTVITVLYQLGTGGRSQKAQPIQGVYP